MGDEIKDGDTVKLSAKVAIWISAALLYACEAAPLFFRIKNGGGFMVTLVIGVFISAAGIVIEALADHQKQVEKRYFPNQYVSSGLFSIVRCPNYFGELLMWTGVFISGFGACYGFCQWLAALVGYIGIVYVMFSGARRLELRQERTYGSDPGYRKYASTTPLMIPFVPIYSVKDISWLVA